MIFLIETGISPLDLPWEIVNLREVFRSGGGGLWSCQGSCPTGVCISFSLRMSFCEFSQGVGVKLSEIHFLSGFCFHTRLVLFGEKSRSRDSSVPFPKPFSVRPVDPPHGSIKSWLRDPTDDVSPFGKITNHATVATNIYLFYGQVSTFLEMTLRRI